MKKFAFMSFPLILLLMATQVSFAQTYYNTLEYSVFSNIWIGTQTIDSGFAHSGCHYSLSDSIEQYGLGIEMEFPENLKSKNTSINVEGWALSDTNFINGFFVITVIDKGKQVFWRGINLNDFINEKNTWFKFSDSVRIPANITKSASIKAFLWNASHKQKLGLDDLKFSFHEIKNPTYLPSLEVNDDIAEISNENYLFSNTYYSVYYDDEKHLLSIFGKDFSPIIKNVSVLLEQENNSDFTPELVYKKSRVKKGDTHLFFNAKSSFSKFELEIICKANSSKIDFETKNHFYKDIDIARTSLVLKVKPKPSEIYRFNRQLQTSDFQDEYWLDKQGLKLGNADSSLIIYHCPNISSLQYDNVNSEIFVNLDWEKDHPFFRFPLAPDSTDWKLEQSFSTYKRGDETRNSFSAYAGNKLQNIVRFMKNPSAYEATYIWTEHADFSDIRTNRATYFGSEKIHDVDSAIGGFVKFNIPVTKSVFYDNPDSINNVKASNNLINSLECAIKTDSAFSRFLNEINKKGSEICLHTPEQFTTTPSRLDEALAYMKDNFSSPSWIDHGNNNKLHNNREDLICDGTLPASKWYAMGLWKKYGVKYLHNAYYEENSTFMNAGFNVSIEKAYTGWGDFFPKPDFWQHKSKTGDIYHWPTASVLFVEKNDLWSYYFNKNNFNDFISNWSVEINHCYPAWVDPKKGFWTYDEDSVIIAQPGFNNTLKLMALLRDEGKLNICTIKDFMDYQLATQNIDYEILADGRIKVSNNTSKPIKGISFASAVKFVLVDRLRPKQKFVGNDIVFWFDIKQGESKIIRLIE